MNVSVVIPTLNEEGNLKDSIASIGGKAEVIVADGGSSDSTLEVASVLGAITVRSSRRGRGLQMDSGASLAAGDVILFLHADTRLPEGWFEAISGAMRDKDTVGGGFSLSIGSDKLFFRILERLVRVRSRRLGLIYGDQAIFVRKESFFKAGGFKRLPLMEDVDCVKRLRKLGKVVLLDERVTTSARRWDGAGALRNTIKNLILISLYFLGVSPQRLYTMYYRER